MYIFSYMFNQLKLTKLVMQNMVVQIHRNDETNLVFEQLGNPMTQIYKCDNEFPQIQKKIPSQVGARLLRSSSLACGPTAWRPCGLRLCSRRLTKCSTSGWSSGSTTTEGRPVVFGSNYTPNNYTLKVLKTRELA